jgi:fibronectin type 3 domain-containing protein
MWRKAILTAGALAAMLLCGAWFASTSGKDLGARLHFPAKRHSVHLRWQASVTPGVKYNVYRSSERGKHFTKLNAKPVSELSYTDKDVQSGATYYYVTRSLNKQGTESVDSNEVEVKVP